MAKRDFPTRVNGILAHITWTPHTDRPITLTGTAIYASDGVRIDGIKPVRRKANTVKDIEYAQSVIVSILTEKIEQQQRKQRKEDKSEKSIERVFYKLFGSDLISVGGKRNHPIYGWGESTQRACVKYFQSNILPIIKEIDDESDFSKVERDELFDVLTRKALKNGNNISGIEGARIVASKHMKEAARIYAEMVHEEPSLPNIIFECDFTGASKKNEQIKTLPYHIHKKFRELVMEEINQQPYLARAAVLMDSAGMRSGEAAATWSGWHEDYGDYMVIKIIYQEENGKRCERLKSENAYRCVVLDEWGTQALRKCNQYIGNEPFTAECPVTDKEVSAWVKEKLIEAGCTSDFMAEAIADLELYHDFDSNGRPIRDIAAYVCRRNRASIWRNICGYTQDELDYALGHKAQSSKRVYKDDPLSEQTLKKLAIKNWHYDMHHDISLSPKHRPLSLSCLGQHTDITPFDVVRIVNATQHQMGIRIDVTAMEAGESLELVTSKAGCIDVIRRNINSQGQRMHTYVIGSLNIEDEATKGGKQ